MIGPVFIANEALAWSSGGSLWQSLGGLVVVFGLLIVTLKIMGRFNRRNQSKETQLLTVWHLGPRREIQVLRLGDEVHYIYRHDGAMVLLKQESLAQWETFQSRLEAEETPAGKISSLLSGRFSSAQA